MTSSDHQHPHSSQWGPCAYLLEEHHSPCLPPWTRPGLCPHTWRHGGARLMKVWKELKAWPVSSQMNKTRLINARCWPLKLGGQVRRSPRYSPNSPQSRGRRIWLEEAWRQVTLPLLPWPFILRRDLCLSWLGIFFAAMIGGEGIEKYWNLDFFFFFFWP